MNKNEEVFTIPLGTEDVNLTTRAWTKMDIDRWCLADVAQSLQATYGPIIQSTIEEREQTTMHPDELNTKNAVPIDRRAHRKAQIENEFTYHAPKGDQAERYGRMREKAKEFALLIVELTPASREQDEALTMLNLSAMSANAAIARHE